METLGFLIWGFEVREWLDLVLAFIGSTSLTDPEYAGIDQTGMVVQTYNQEAYDQLSAVLEAREAVSTTRDRLIAVFKAKGTDVVAADVGNTNIYIGDVLE